VLFTSYQGSRPIHGPGPEATATAAVPAPDHGETDAVDQPSRSPPLRPGTPYSTECFAPHPEDFPTSRSERLLSAFFQWYRRHHSRYGAVKSPFFNLLVMVFRSRRT